MAIRYYILPLDVVNTASGTSRGPKYFSWRLDPDPPALVTANYALIDYGLMPICLLVSDVTTEQHNLLNAQTDVIVIPANIDANIGGGNIATVRSRLEALKIPGNVIQASDTYREALRIVAGVFQFAQKYHAMHNLSIFDEVTTLNTTWAELSTDFQNHLLETATVMNINTSGVTANTTMRQILKVMSDKWQGAPILIGGNTL